MRRQALHIWLPFVIILSGWEFIVPKWLGVSETTVSARQGRTFVDESSNNQLPAVLDALEAERMEPFWLVLGNSQVRVVKSGDSADAFSFQLGIDTGQNIVDLSSGGQTLAESNKIAALTLDRFHVERLIIGVGIFSAASSGIRDGIKNDGDAAASGAESSVPTIQHQVETRLTTWSSDSLRSVEHREEIFNRLISSPIRRDLVAYVKRRSGFKVARSYRLGANFEEDIENLTQVATEASQRGIPVSLIIMPYENTRPPTPYSRDDELRLRRALRQIETSTTAELLDFSELLDASNFGTFVDGSPDAFHFDARGHRALAYRYLESVPAASE